MKTNQVKTLAACQSAITNFRLISVCQIAHDLQSKNMIGFRKTLALGLFACLSIFGNAETDADRFWLYWHFAGTESIRANVQAKTIHEIWKLPQSSQLSNLFIERLVQASERQAFGPHAFAPALRHRLLTEFVKGILKHESIGAIGGMPSRPSLSLAVRLPETMHADWEKNLKHFLNSLDWKLPKQSDSDKLNLNQSNSKEPISNQSDSEESHFEQSDSKQFDSRESDFQESKSKQFDSGELDSDQSDFGELGLKQSDSDQSDFQESHSGELDFEKLVLDQFDSKRFDSEESGLEDLGLGEVDWIADHPDLSLLARFVKKGDWLIFSIGSDLSLPSCFGEIERGMPPLLPESAVLSFGGNLQKLALWLANVSIRLPSFSAIFKPEKDGVRTEASIHLQQSTAFPLPKWRVPRELISDRIVSFSAARGMSEIIRDFPFAKRFVDQGLPNQFFSWSRISHSATKSVPLFPMYFAWRIDEDEIPIDKLTNRLPEILGKEILNRARLVSIPNRNEVILAMVPAFIQPFLRGISADGGVRIAGLFPFSAPIHPAPDALFEQLTNKENIVYYQWEITQRRIEIYKILFRLLAFLFDKPQGGTEAMGFKWLSAIESKMGNAATLISASGPNQWKLIRKSYFGLTGLELTLLARWIEADCFPWIEVFSKPSLPHPPPPNPNEC